MEQNKEYIWINKSFKGEDWIITQRSLIKEFGFVKSGDFELISSKTNQTYKFITIGEGDEKFVSRIEILIEGEFKQFFLSAFNKEKVIERFENFEAKNKIQFPKIRERVVDTLGVSVAPRWFAELLNQNSSHPAVSDLKQYLGMEDKEVFCVLNFLELDFENYGGLLCRVVRRKPQIEHRAIKTPCGIFYAVPIKYSFEELIDCIISQRILIDILGFEGLIDIYYEEGTVEI